MTMTDGSSDWRSACVAMLLVITCAAAGALLALAMVVPGYHWLVWCSLLPYGFLLSARTPQAVACSGAFLGAAVFHMAALWWMCSLIDGAFTPIWVFSTLMGATCLMAAVILVRRGMRGRDWPMALALPLAWIAYESMRHWAFVLAEGNGATMVSAGLAATRYNALMQIADVGGVYALTCLVALINGAGCDVLSVLLRRRRGRQIIPAVTSVAVGIVALAASLVYGSWRVGQLCGPVGPTIAMVSGMLPDEILAQPLRDVQVHSPGTPPRLLSAEAAFRVDADLYAWPEMSFAQGIAASHDKGKEPSSREKGATGITTLEAIARRLRAPIAVGSQRVEGSALAGEERAYNSVIYVVPERGLQGVYDKWHLVALLESTPGWIGRLGWSRSDLCGFEIARREFTRGARAVPFVLRDVRGGDAARVGATICYDVCFPDVHRCYMNSPDDQSPDVFLCAMDESLDGTGVLARLSFMHTQLRAVECRRPYYRVSKGGLNGITDSCGRILVQVQDQRSGPMVVLGQVASDQRSTLYAVYGDWVPILMCIMLAGMNISGIGSSALRCLFVRVRKVTPDIAQRPRPESER